MDPSLKVSSWLDGKANLVKMINIMERVTILSKGI